MRRRIVIALLALFSLHGPARADEPATVPFPTDGLDEPPRGIPGLPLEFKDSHGDLHRRTARPIETSIDMFQKWGAEFEYRYADAAVEKAVVAEARAIGIRITAFLDPGTAHRYVFEKSIKMTPEEYEAGAPARRWNDGIKRVPLPGLFFQGDKPTSVGLSGITRHTVVEVFWDQRPFSDRGGDTPAAVEEMRKRTTGTCEAVIRLVQDSPPAESPDARNVKRIQIESIPTRRSGGSPMDRLTAETHASDNNTYRPTTMWIDGASYTNVGPAGTRPTITAEFPQSTMLDKMHIFCVDEGPVFHLFRITNFRVTPAGCRWP